MKREYAKPRRITVDLVGEVFGRLSVLSMLGSYRNKVYWSCLCSCGNTSEVHTAALCNGNTKSCGCLNRENLKISNTRHGLSSTREYRSWAHMMTRVYDEKCDHYHRYGGRGLIVEDRFHDVRNFVAYMGDCPEGMTLERPDNDIGYVTGNMVWATSFEQSRNKSSSTYVEVDGKTMVMSDAAEHMGLSRATLVDRLSRGLTIEDMRVRPKFAKKIVLFEGQPTNLTAVSVATGIKYATLWNRMSTQGLSLNDAIKKGIPC